MGDAGSKIRAFFMYVTNTVSAPKIKKKTSFFCERARCPGATAVAMFFPTKDGEVGFRLASNWPAGWHETAGAG
jgi:hypothetical protein